LWQVSFKRFLAQHSKIKLGKPSSLDACHAQAFNKHGVSHHFELLKKIITEHEIPYNMDEKSCQLGGGQNQHKSFLFLTTNVPN
jgi:hypothetical protein